MESLPIVRLVAVAVWPEGRESPGGCRRQAVSATVGEEFVWSGLSCPDALLLRIHLRFVTSVDGSRICRAETRDGRLCVSQDVYIIRLMTKVFFRLA